jgi:response regulator of citrate/malate metabolism
MKKLNTILLVDDDNITNQLNKMLFKKLDLSNNLLVATNGKEALNIIEELCKRITAARS